MEKKRMNKWYMKLFRTLYNATVLSSHIQRNDAGRETDQLKF